MLHTRIHIILLAAIATSLGLVACSASIEAFSAPTDESYPPEQVEQGLDVYLRTCATCHGVDGGGGAGPNIRQVWERLSFDEHVAVVNDGRANMPAFGRSLSPEDLASVIAYQRFGWGDPVG